MTSIVVFDAIYKLVKFRLELLPVGIVLASTLLIHMYSTDLHTLYQSTQFSIRTVGNVTVLYL